MNNKKIILKKKKFRFLIATLLQHGVQLCSQFQDTNMELVGFKAPELLKGQ